MNVGKNGAAAFGKNGLGGTNGAAFWNIILGSSPEGTSETDGKSLGEFGTKNKSEGIKKEKADLALLQLALLGQDADKTLDEKLSELRIERIAQSKENRIEQLTKLINHLTSGLPAEVDTENKTNIEELVARLTRRLERLEASLDAFRTGDFSDEDAPFKLLIATGLNPAQLTKITNRIEEVETKLGRELTVEDLIAGVGNIIPVPGSKKDEDDELSVTDALALLTNEDGEEINLGEVVEIKEETPEAALDLSGTEIETETPPLSETEFEIESEIEIETEIQANNETPKENIGQVISENIKNIENKEKRNFVHQQVLQMLEAVQVAPAGTPFNALRPANGNEYGEALSKSLPQSLSNADFNALFKDGVNLEKSNSKINFGTLKSGVADSLAATPAFGKPGALYKNFGGFENSLSQSILSDALGYDIETGTPFSNIMQAAHHISSANVQAGQAHPATSMVAAQITKSAQNSDTSKITLQLDPPELGRVEVRLEFGKDKSVKAHLVVEKPETYLMLQRDAHALERALQNAGLDTDSSSLNYQMAQDNYDFNSFGDGRGSNDSEGESSNGSDMASNDDVLIETTMTWDVDPETGHVHYNLLA
ncbi:MAG: flagellar hook-length control protein FliK [Alphaproteobacteria bacterium]